MNLNKVSLSLSLQFNEFIVETLHMYFVFCYMNFSIDITYFYDQFFL
jgi:hypothetical protein